MATFSASVQQNRTRENPLANTPMGFEQMTLPAGSAFALDGDFIPKLVFGKPLLTSDLSKPAN